MQRPSCLQQPSRQFKRHQISENFYQRNEEISVVPILTVFEGTQEFHNISHDGVNHIVTNDLREHSFIISDQLRTMWHFITCKHHSIISDEWTIPSHLTQVDIIKS